MYRMWRHIVNTGFNEFGLVFLTFVLFNLGNCFVLNRIVPQSVRTSKHLKWKWRNISSSVIHSSIAIIGMLVGFYQHSNSLIDCMHSWTPVGQYLLAMSTGYFLYDLVDILLKVRRTYVTELIVHHLLVIACIVIAISVRRFQGIGLTLVMTEVSGIFLQLRQLLLIAGWHRKSVSFQIIALLNLVTFLTLRFSVVFLLGRWLTQHLQEGGFYLWVVGVTLAAALPLNLFTILRVIQSDFLVRTKTKAPDELEGLAMKHRLKNT